MYNEKNKKRGNSSKGSSFSIGDRLYFSCFNDNKTVVEALINTTKSALKPYHNFLNKAIRAEELKGSYEIDWKKVESNFSLKITPRYSKFKINKPKTQLKIFNIKKEDILEERNKLFFDEQDKIYRFNKQDIEFNDGGIIVTPEYLPKINEPLELNNEIVNYELIKIELYKGNYLKINDKELEILEIAELDDSWNIKIETNENIKEILFNSTILICEKYRTNFTTLKDGDKEFVFEQVGNSYLVEKLPKNKFLVDENGNEYIPKQEKASSGDYAIQLIDDDSLDEQKVISEYFLADDTKSIYQESKREKPIDIKQKKSEDKILVLKQHWEEEISLNTNEKIKIKVDTGNLKKQRDSIETLNLKPVKNQRNLIKLFEDKIKGEKWNKPKNISIDNWYILKDESYEGTLEQREFVEKALGTDDFAILEGPPGSGKTTTILELILQMIKEGKKILLSASTHVAIDNVLERIKEKDIDNLVEPLRIGREDSVGEVIKEFQFDNRLEQYKKNGFNEELAKKLVIDSANLVCGTTMGINQFPPIQERITYENNKRKETLLPIDTIFDCMIIDESSKTTFQEFLVPAMYAKKWILVGDIKQLSPYIEKSHIEHNLRNTINSATQKAIRIVFETLSNNSNPYIVEVSEKEEFEIKKYLEYWRTQEKNPYKEKIVAYSDEKDILKRLGSDLILVEEGRWDSVKKCMPKTHLVILKEKREEDDFWFKQNYLLKKRKLPKYFEINKKESESNNPYEYQEIFSEMLKEKDWAEEIAWRMIRVYERRMLKNPNSYYEKSYELLKPVKNNSVERIYNMTLPSILESIQVGNGEKHRNSTVITEGFSNIDLKPRHAILNVQHRMHKDISKFSREEFYTTTDGQALKDTDTTDRNWDYEKYSKRSVWIDTPKDPKKNKSDRVHQKEVEVIIEEIKKFIDFAKENPVNKDNEPWSIAVLTYYRPQESLLRSKLQEYCYLPNKVSRFHKDGVNILLYTVDKFQGMEADIVFLSMVRGKNVGFMDNINRLNVALTRAKYQRVIVGDKAFFKIQEGSKELERLAKEEVSV